MTEQTFLGYRRPDGQVGVRNHVLVLSAMDSANPTVRRVGSMVSHVLPLTIQYGRGQYGADAELTRRALVGLGANPNVAACVVVSLEPVSAGEIAEAIAKTGKPVEAVAIQSEGDPLAAALAAARHAARLVRQASRQRREPAPLSSLLVGLECGGSDTTSGIASNPTVGWLSDRIVEAGGRVCLGETSEILGAEHILAQRTADESVRQELLHVVVEVEREAGRRGVDIRGANPVPDNIRGGLTTIEEKSLGAILKGGSSPVQQVLAYGERLPAQSGLYVMDTPAPAVESITGMIAGGCQLIAFTTGVGNSIGTKIAPVVKVSGNPHTVAAMSSAIDVDVSGITLGRETMASAGQRLLDGVLEFAEGSLTASEVLGEEEIAISKIGTTI